MSPPILLGINPRLSPPPIYGGDNGGSLRDGNLGISWSPFQGESWCVTGATGQALGVSSGCTEATSADKASVGLPVNFVGVRNGEQGHAQQDEPHRLKDN